MNVYDFDKTIYDGDSSVDFYWFCLKRQGAVWKALPLQIKGFVWNLLGKYTKTEMKQAVFSYLRYVSDVDLLVQEFWQSHEQNLKHWYLDQKQENDVVISASPEFLLWPVMQKLGITAPIASRVNKRTGEFTSINCHGQEKVRRYYEIYPQGNIEKFYSDSLVDTPLAMIANQAYLVRKNTILPWPGK